MFCYLFAKHNKGQFKLRIEDTDAERNDESAVTAIIQGMNWLGCPHDGEIVRQSANCKRHQEVGQELLKSGGAFKCYCTKEELDKMREDAEKAKVPFRYPGICRAKGYKPPAGRTQPVIRIKTPSDGGVTAWDDGVMGHIEFANKDIDDFIILRGDGTPTYLLAVVVDDHDMGITQVIRGSDHIPNTGRQIAVFKNMNWELPDFAHIPLIHGADGKKLSKRHGATGLEQFETLGYLPEGIRNYLARLSWGHGNDEIFSLEQAVEWFELKDCSKAAPCFDFDKLNAINQHYIQIADVDRLTDILFKLFPELKSHEKQLRDPRVAKLFQDRAKTMVEYKEAAEFMFAKRPIAVEEAAQKNIAKDADKNTLKLLSALLKAHKGEWTPEALEALIKAFATEKAMKLGDCAKPCRAALTGSMHSPGLFEVIWILGKDETVARFDDAAAGKTTIKVPKAKEPEAAPAEEKPKAAAAPAAATIDGPVSDEQVANVGEEIRALKVKLKADGLSGKKIDASDEVKALVAKLVALKAALEKQKTDGPKAASPKAAAKKSPKASPKGGKPAANLEDEIKTVGDDIRALKTKLKETGLSGKKIDKDEAVIALVEKLQTLKTQQA